jgi:hypothetical protein
MLRFERLGLLGKPIRVRGKRQIFGEYLAAAH